MTPGVSYRMKRFIATLVLTLAITIAGIIAQIKAPSPTPSTPPAQETATEGSALQKLDTLAIKGRAPKTNYSRSQFGNGWAQWRSCDTRNKILGRDLQNISYRDDTCVVLSGTLQDPYTAKPIHFQRGSHSDAVQIDHVVALADAWQKGAQQLSREERVAFANHDLNLLAVDGPANQQKGSGDAATWLPKNKSFRCTYIARQVAVKALFRLWVTQAEHDAMKTVLETCPGQPLPAK